MSTPATVLPPRSAVLDDAHLGDIKGALGTIAHHDTAPHAVAALVAEAQPRLLALNSRLQGTLWTLGRSEVRVGKDAQAELSIPHRSLADFHAKLLQTPGNEWRVQELARAGVRVNGVAYADSPLHDGDVVEPSACASSAQGRPPLSCRAARAPASPSSAGPWWPLRFSPSSASARCVRARCRLPPSRHTRSRCWKSPPPPSLRLQPRRPCLPRPERSSMQPPRDPWRQRGWCSGMAATRRPRRTRAPHH